MYFIASHLYPWLTWAILTCIADISIIAYAYESRPLDRHFLYSLWIWKLTFGETFWRTNIVGLLWETVRRLLVTKYSLFLEEFVRLFTNCHQLNITSKHPTLKIVGDFQLSAFCRLCRVFYIGWCWWSVANLCRHEYTVVDPLLVGFYWGR